MSTGNSIQRKPRTPEYRIWCAMKTRCYNPAQMLSINGETLSLKEWAHKLRMPYSTLCYRLRQGWSIEEILER